MITVYINTLLVLFIGTIISMQLVRMHATGFWLGFAFGTLGLVILAFLRLAFPLMEWVTTPFFWPSHFFAELFTDGSASTFIVIILYLLTGSFYGLCGSWIQSIYRRKRLPKLSL